MVAGSEGSASGTVDQTLACMVAVWCGVRTHELSISSNANYAGKSRDAMDDPLAQLASDLD